MTHYQLHVESGPKRRKTMVHVLDLLGCIANGPTTEAALEATPGAIRDYLRFLKRHGDAVKPDAPFTTKVTQHVMEGVWLGQGDPDKGFPHDFQPLTAKDQATYLKRLAWLEADLLQIARDTPPKQLVAEPEGGRPIRRILEHLAGAHYAYLQSPLSKPKGLSQALRLVEQGPDLPMALAGFWRMATERLEATTEAERSGMIQHGVKTWSARRAFRRMLEHDWEHLTEITRRLEQAAR
jgi:predicted RNase H-like HicB family nuclease